MALWIPIGMRPASLLTAVLFLVASSALPALAATIQIDDTDDIVMAADGRCTLREAIDNANLPGGGDTTLGDCAAGSAGSDTLLIPAGSYALALAGSGEDGNASGDLDILDDAVLAGDGPGATVIEAVGSDRAVDVAPAAQTVEVELQGLSLVDGLVPPPSRGGGLRVGPGASVIFVEGEVIGCAAEQGGGISNEGSLLLQVVRLQGNQAPFGSDGGGLYNRGQAELFSCDVRANSADARGGGLFNDGEMSVEDSLFDFNVAEFGGAAFNSGQANFIGADFGVNQSNLDGGALYHSGSFALLDDCRFLNNSAMGNGAAIYSAGDLELRNSSLQGGVAFGSGGGIDHEFGSLLVIDSAIEMNLCAEFGGGIRNAGILEASGLDLRINTAGVQGAGLFNSGSAALSVSDVSFNQGGDGAGVFTEGFVAATASLFANNFANRGGGIWVAGSGLVDLLNSTVSGNGAVSDGAGLVVEGTAQLEFSTVTANGSAGGAGGGVLNTGIVVAKNSLIAGNAVDCVQLGVLTSLGYNLDSDGTCGLGAGPGDISAVGPNLGPLANNGGPTMTHAPLLPSPAIDSADPNCFDRAGTPVGSDQRLLSRPIDGDGDLTARCDRGAHEASAPSGPVPPVPDGIAGSPLLVDKLDPTAVDLALSWDVGVCPATGYHLIFGELSDVSAYTLGGSECGLNPSGVDTWIDSPPRSIWFVIVGNDGVETEGSWGAATAGQRNGAGASLECGISIRDNGGTCP